MRGTENQGVKVFKIRKKKWFKELAKKVLISLFLRYLGIDWIKLFNFCLEFFSHVLIINLPSAKRSCRPLSCVFGLTKDSFSLSVGSC